MPSVVGICNLALLRIGVRKFITSLTSNGTESEASSILFEHARDLTLEKFDWPFARKRAFMALLEGEERAGWAYSYATPVDCITPRFLESGITTPAEKDKIPFEVESAMASSQTIIATNQFEAKLVYTARIEDPKLFTPGFADSLAWHLGAELALAIPNKAGLETLCRQRFTMALDAAKVAAVKGRQKGERPESEFITERG